MKEVAGLLNRLEINAREELAAQDRMLVLLEHQEAAIISGRAESVVSSTKEIEAETQAGVKRATSRHAILGDLGAAWGVPADVMTLSSVAERAGEKGERLVDLRKSLRERAGRVLKKNRKIAAVANLHRKVMQEVIDEIFADESDAIGVATRSSGSLIDAEA